MFSDSHIRRLEEEIKKMRLAIQKFQKEEDDVRRREEEAIRHIQLEAKHKIEIIRHHRENDERAIKYKEQELLKERAEQNKQMGQAGTNHH